MNYNENKKKIKIFAGSFIIVIIIFFALLFSGSAHIVPQVKVSSSLVDKIRQSQKQGTILELNKEEFNEIIGMYFKKGKSLNGIEIKGIDGDIKNSKVIFHMPLSYKGFNLLVSSEGGLTYLNNKVEYKPSYFKIGKVALPKNFVMNQVKDHLKETICIENNSIAIDKNMIPLQIKSIEIKENKVFIGINKSSNTLEEKLKTAGGKKSLETAEEKDELGQNSSSAADKEKSTGSTSNSSGMKQNVAQMDAALDRISGGLSSAMSSCSTGGQKAVISQMISATNSMKGNPNANPYAYAEGVRSSYNILSPQEKAELKSAVFSNIDGNDVNIVSKMLGK